jgi:hypothetical protein
MAKRRAFLFAFMLIIGLFALLNALSNRRLAGLHGTDVIQLVASGLCFPVRLRGLGRRQEIPRGLTLSVSD